MTTSLHAHANDELTPLNCEQTVRRMWDYLDNELTAFDAAAVDRHLAECEKCLSHFTFEREFLNTVRSARTAVAESDPSRSATLRERIRGLLGRR
ncbi:MAG: anti-sigma factor family protein [Gemmatimonas sp.]